MIIKSVANTPIRISEFPGDLFLSIDLSQVEFGRTESLDIEKISLEAVAIQATPHAKIAAITNNVIDTKLRIAPINSGIGTVTRIPIGSYIQIDNEMMRVTSSALSGSGLDEITVIRGVLGSLKASHAANSIIKKIKPLPVEFRRPSILRASGHTFEYLGFGPGNYSTGLPQVQNRTLTEREEFLSQSQEKSGGAVVYTGMNNRGDFYIGNKRVTSTTGEETTFDAPTPTVTGQDPSRLSVIFDEVVVKERIIIEGGKSNRVLSQFDGPVTFNNEIKINANTTITGTLKINNTLEITDGTQSNNKDEGCYVIEGGMGIEKNANIGGDLTVAGISTFTGNIDVNGIIEGISGQNKIPSLYACLLYTSPSPRDLSTSRMPSSA